MVKLSVKFTKCLGNSLRNFLKGYKIKLCAVVQYFIVFRFYQKWSKLSDFILGFFGNIFISLIGKMALSLNDWKNGIEPQ